jgi:hypothetical protein
MNTNASGRIGNGNEERKREGRSLGPLLTKDQVMYTFVGVRRNPS